MALESEPVQVGGDAHHVSLKALPGASMQQQQEQPSFPVDQQLSLLLVQSHPDEQTAALLSGHYNGRGI